MQKTLKTFTLLASTAIALTAQGTEQNDKRFYLQGNLGIAMGMHPGKDFEQNSLGTAGVYGAAIGYKFTEHFRADFGVDYRDGFTNKWTHREYVPKAESNVSDTQNSKVNSWSTMITGYFDIVEINGFTPYVFAGAGISRNKVEVIGNCSFDSPDYEPSNYSFSKEAKLNFAWKIGAGTKYKINDSFDIGINYQYADLGKFTTGNTKYTTIANNGSSARPFEKSQGKLKSNEFFATLIYKF